MQEAHTNNTTRIELIPNIPATLRISPYASIGFEKSAACCETELKKQPVGGENRRMLSSWRWLHNICNSQPRIISEVY
jgi:hypothetical protein